MMHFTRVYGQQDANKSITILPISVKHENGNRVK